MNLCPECITEPKENYRKCLCGGYFYHEPKRGRPPTASKWYREHQSAAKVQERQEKKETKEKTISGLTAVPVFEPISDITQMKKGMRVYTRNTLFNSEIHQRLYAKDYRIIEINEDAGTVLVSRGSEYKPISAAFNRFNVKTGVEYLNVETYNDVTEEEVYD